MGLRPTRRDADATGRFRRITDLDRVFNRAFEIEDLRATRRIVRQSRYDGWMIAGMGTWRWTFAMTTTLLASCGSRHAFASPPDSLSESRAAAVKQEVRAFMRVVAHDVTQDGPAAWRKHFAESPSFFMAADGQLAFPNSAAATAGIQDLARSIRQIELQWADDLRIDPLTPNLAMVATSYHEVRVNTGGDRVNETGFFTAVAEYRDGRWQFRNAHWSVPVPPAAR